MTRQCLLTSGHRSRSNELRVFSCHFRIVRAMIVGTASRGGFIPEGQKIMMPPCVWALSYCLGGYCFVV